MTSTAKLKEDARNYHLRFELVEKDGETGEKLPKAGRGLYSVQKVGTNFLILVGEDGRTTRVPLLNSKLVEYDGQILAVYRPGDRPFTEDERRVMEEWERELTAYLRTRPFYYGVARKKKQFFKESKCPWLGSDVDPVKGKTLSFEPGMVTDNRVRGERILMYRVYREE
jgi:hypothetical protein